MISNSVHSHIQRTVTNAKVSFGVLPGKASNVENAESNVTKNAKIFSTRIVFNVSNERLRQDLLERRTNERSASCLGRAQKNAKHGADDKAKNLMEAMHEKMTLRESTRPVLFKTIR